MKLGDKVVDPITGFTGVVTGHAQYLHAQDLMLVEAPVVDPGKESISHWIAATRLEPLPS